MQQRAQTKGFTLIELLVVIAIVAILSVVVILTLNPAELLRQARDSNRISDLATLKSAISLYLADGQTASIGADGRCYAARSTTTVTCGGRFGGTTTSTATTSRAVSGSGWLPVDFTLITSGAPISNLPVDPLGDNATYYYAYTASSSGGVFELTAKMESTKYGTGTGDVENSDGGNNTDHYEVGTKLDF
jgi:prepilin-type N-terminal cleavage/methylation domain-containing protein